MKHVNIIFCFFSFLLTNNILSQNFIEREDVSLPGVFHGSTVWGDYDNDGDLDLLLSGYNSKEATTMIFNNVGNGRFIKNDRVILDKVSYSSLAWGDYNRDGYLDFVICGIANSQDPTSVVYKNDCNGGFIKQNIISLIGVYYGSVEWGDCDNDGDLDLLLTGYDSKRAITKIYYNDGAGKLVESNKIQLEAVYHSSATWGDCDNDGDLDILLTGYNGSEGVSKIYINKNDSSFVEDSNITLMGIYYGDAAWGDCDNDGDLDILLTGYDGNEGIVKIYKNNGSADYTADVNTSIEGLYHSSASWGDYNNDNYLDFILIGKDGNSSLSKAYINNGYGSFSVDKSINLTNVHHGSIAFGDYDSDNDLDIVLFGLSTSTDDFSISRIYENINSEQNNIPKPPTDLSIKIDPNNDVTFKWNPQLNVKDSKYHFSYNIAVGTKENLNDIISPLSDNSLGTRRISQAGKIVGTNSYTIKNLSPGRYFWKIQSIDNSFNGSIFSKTSSFEIGSQSTLFDKDNKSIQDYQMKRVDWGDYDNDGDLDAILTNSSDSLATISVYNNNNNNRFSKLVKIETLYSDHCEAGWQDYDSDNDLDILLVAWTKRGIISKTYINSGLGDFQEQPEIYLERIDKFSENSLTSLDGDDTDSDGIIDSLDYCINERETFNFYLDEDGCPDKSEYPDSVNFNPGLKLFLNNSAILTQDVIGTIQIELAYLIIDYPTTYWVIEVESKYLPEEKAKAIKAVIDESTGQPGRTKIKFNFGPETKASFLIDKIQAQNQTLEKIYLR